MSNHKTLDRLGQRFQKRPGPGVTAGPERTPQAPRRGKKQRARQSLHFADQSMKDLDNAYRKAEHDSYPTKLNKAIFVEALIAYGIQHADEVTALALDLQAEEEEEE